jgi:hypothetical protein
VKEGKKKGQGQPKRFTVIWAPEARSDLRAIDKEAALQILHCLDRYLRHLPGNFQSDEMPSMVLCIAGVWVLYYP